MTALEDELQRAQAAEPDVSPDHAFLLWFIRNVLGVEDLDAYAYAFEAPRTAVGLQFDGAFLTGPEEPAEESGILNLIEVNRSQDLKTVQAWIAAAAQTLSAPPSQPREEVLADLLAGLDVDSSRKLDKGRLRVRLHLVTPDLGGQPTVQSLPGVEVDWFTRDTLEQVARAVSGPSAVIGEIEVAVPDGEVLQTRTASGDVFVCPVGAREIAEWPGIVDRTLFDLNVRFELGSGRVRRSLDSALTDPSEQADFLAFHNGLTVVCDRIDRTPTGLRVTNFSVVNGAQSVLAFYRHKDTVHQSLRVLVKFAAVDTQSAVAREVAIRSNTQNPVNSRNLRALDPRQLTLKAAIEEDYPDYRYELRPDLGKTDGRTVIRNDDAAQLLCAIYDERPWLAVKRLSLFEPPDYQRIFSPRIRATHIVLSHRISVSVASQKSDFPTLYQKAWRLTALVGAYLVGQIFRGNDSLKGILDTPAEMLASDELDAVLVAAVTSAAAVLARRAEAYVRSGEVDDFKVDFKREAVLRKLASEARSTELSIAWRAAQ